MNPNMIWEDTLLRLESFFKENGNGFVFDTYIKSLKVQHIDENNCYILTSDGVQREMIRTRFKDRIKTALDESISKATGKISDCEIVIVTENEFQERKMEIESKGDLNLNPAYTFDNFVVGNSNSLTHAACRAVVDMPGVAYNPLFIYGGVGLGKTHLMQAIGNSMLAKNPNTRIIYTTTENFVGELVEAIRKQEQEQFKRKYRNCDLFMLDDIQFISRITSAKEELFHTFNSLHQAGKQIVISSDKSPEDIPNLEERLLSRFKWGLLTKIDKPDYETRVAILREKLPYIRSQTRTEFDIEDEVLHMIASKEDSNIRDLEGVLKNVIMQAKLYSSTKPSKMINAEMARGALADFLQDTAKKVITPKFIISTVCSYFDVSEADLVGKVRTKDLTVPRQICMYMLREECKMSYKAIGAAMGGKDHSTVMHNCSKIEEEVKTRKETQNLVNDIKDKLMN